MATIARVVAFAAIAAAFCTAAGAVDPSRLSSMPLPRDALGKDGLELLLAADSGVDSNADAARKAGHGITGTDLARAGRVTGYTLDYFLTDRAKPQNVLGMQTIAELYRSKPAATKGLSFWHRITESLGTSRAQGVTIALSPFDAQVGDGAYAFELTYSRGGKPIGYLGDVVFRTGALLGTVYVTVNDDTGLRPRTLQLARKLLARMHRAARGG